MIDFGIARASDESEGTLTSTGTVIGSVGFMSPEQARSGPVDAASDVFALGAVLYGVVRGPFAGTSVPQTLYNIVHTPPPLDRLPPGVRALVGPCLEKNPALRPTPAGIQQAAGRIAPPPRPWPAGVHRLIDEQHAELARILDASRPQGDRSAGFERAAIPTMTAAATAAAGTPCVPT